MKLSDTVNHAVLLLQQSQRLTYRALKLECELTDEQLDVLKEELIEAREVAVDKDGKVLVWTGSLASSVQSLGSEKQRPIVPGQTLDPRLPDPRPISYTPAHLAERIRAVSVTDGARKTITALFADLKGSTALIEGLDPEEAGAIIDPALHLMLAQAKAGHGQIVGVMGEPGLGKSRLFYEFVGAIHESPLRLHHGCLVLEASSVSHGKATAYLPVIELLILIFEDLHWIDGETQGFLDVFSESVASAKILLLTNYRPEPCGVVPMSVGDARPR